MDLQSIQSKLIQTVNTLSQSDADVQVDWAGGPQLPVTPPKPAPQPRPSADFAAAVDVLQWRANPAHDYVPAAGASGPLDFPTTVPAQVYVKRLSAMADKVNHLSAEQERAIAEMQAIQARLAQFAPQFGPQGQPLLLPQLDTRRAALASAEVDHQGNILLCYRTVAPTMAPAAPATAGRSPGEPRAAHRRAAYGAPAAQTAWSSLLKDVLALGQEPMQLVSSLGRTAQGLILELTRFSSRRQLASATAGSHPSRGGQLSLVDSVLWFGGGVIGRLALNLLLAAFPALWSVAVAAITTVTAYALYRATLAPKLAFGPAIRVFLLVVGLVIGGQL